MRYLISVLILPMVFIFTSQAQNVGDSIAPPPPRPPDTIPLVGIDSLLLLPDSSVTLSPETLRELRASAVKTASNNSSGESDVVSDMKTREIRKRIVSALDIDNNDDFSSFSMLDSVLDDYRVFFIGENHTFRVSNQKLQLKMFKYLYHNAGVRTLLLEFGYSSGWLMNQYVQTGDSTLYNIFDIYAYKAWTNFVKDLAEFNLSLDSNERIEIIGIDVERFKSIPLKVLALQIPENKPIPEEISMTVESLISLVRYMDADAEEDEEDFFFNYDTYDVSNHVDMFVEEYDSLRTYFIDYLGPERFKVFDSTMVTLKHHLIYDDYKEKRLAHAFIYREKYMYKQFSHVLKRIPEGKFFAQFGRCHVGTLVQEEACSWHNFNSIANRINNSPDPTINGTVCSIGTFYPNSSSYDDESNEIERLDDIVAMAEDEGLTLINVKEGNELFDEFRDMYHYLIINQSKPSDEDDENIEISTEVVEMDFEETRFVIGIGYDQRLTDYNSLNSALSTVPNFAGYEFAPYNSEFQIDMGYSYKNIYSTLAYRRMIGVAFTSLDDEWLALKRWGLIYSFGLGDLSRKTGLTVQANIAYEQMILKVSEDYNPGSGGSSVFGTPLYSEFKRNAAVLSAQAGYHVNLFEFMPIQVFGGYNLDVTYPKWSLESTIAESGPDTRLDGLFFGARVIFLIPME